MNPRRGSAAVAAVLVLLLVGCSDSEGDPGTRPESAEASVPEASESSEPEQEPTETTPTPDVAPATGPAIRVRGLKVRVPEGWNPTIPYAIQQAAAPASVFGSLISVFRFPNSGLYTIDELGDAEVPDMGGRARRHDDVELDGQPFYHLTGNLEPGLYTERFGTIYDDDRLLVQFEFGNGQGKAEQEQIIRSVLATLQVG